jgi:nuclear pore complex protein Nup155
MGTSSKVEEVALQAEHRGLHSLVRLLHSIIEGISFVLVLIEDKLNDIVLSLSETTRKEVIQLSFENLFTEKGREPAKELVTAIVNRNIAAGGTIDAVADALRKRCGSFCSADDVVTYKVILASDPLDRSQFSRRWKL